LTARSTEPATVSPSRWPWWLEWPALFIIYQGFESARGHIHPKAGPSFRNARWLEDLERWTWTLHEAPLNHFVYAHKLLAQVMNAYYGTVHFVIPPIVLIWLWRRHPELYRRMLNALATMTIASLLFFWAVPLAPPRLVPPQPHASFEDTTPFGGLGPLDRGNFKDDNPYAAMPSLHMAWSTWCACAIIAAATGRRRKWRWLALLYPAITLLVVVGTANHWFFDAVGGWLLLAGGWWAATWHPSSWLHIYKDGRAQGGERHG
jgi:hypothetical protein